MFNKQRTTMTYGILLVVTLSITGCAWIESSSRCYNVGNIEWCKTMGSVERKNDSIVLHDSKQKTELWGSGRSANLDCVFVLKFDGDMRDSDNSVGLEIWDPDEHSITFRGGDIKIVTAGKEEVKVAVEPYVGKRIEVHLKANGQRLFAAIDGDTKVDETNTWSERHELQPRLNADTCNTITLYSSSCTTSKGFSNGLFAPLSFVVRALEWFGPRGEVKFHEHLEDTWGQGATSYRFGFVLGVIILIVCLPSGIVSVVIAALQRKRG